MAMLYTIESNGDVLSQELCNPPSYEGVRIALNGATVERVTVLFNGKAAQMFVDEDGQPKNLPFNRRASRIYANLTLYRNGQPTYDDLAKEPPKGVVVGAWDNRPLAIVGRAILWTGKGGLS